MSKHSIKPSGSQVEKHLILMIGLMLMGPQLLISQSPVLEVDGAIKISNVSNPEELPGTIRFNEETNDFEGWNGLYWATLTGYQYEIGSVTDVDGNIYKTVKIGDQEWMAENLRTGSWNSNGQPIGEITDDSEWLSANYPGWCWYENNPAFDEDYGKLYNWYVVNDGRGICPTGWRVPTDDVAGGNSDWEELRVFLGANENGPALRARGSIYWNEENNGSNSSGFNARAGGQRRFDGTWNSQLNAAFFWTSTEENVSNKIIRLLTETGNIGRDFSTVRYGLSIRCIKI